MGGNREQIQYCKYYMTFEVLWGLHWRLWRPITLVEGFLACCSCPGKPALVNVSPAKKYRGFQKHYMTSKGRVKSASSRFTAVEQVYDIRENVSSARSLDSPARKSRPDLWPLRSEAKCKGEHQNMISESFATGSKSLNPGSDTRD